MAARARSAETALDVSLLLAVVIGLERLRVKSGSVIHDLGAQLLAAVVFVMIVFSLGVSVNPLFTGEPVGGPFINLILLGYGLPAVLAGILALVTYAHAALLVQRDRRRHRARPRARLSLARDPDAVSTGRC